MKMIKHILMLFIMFWGQSAYAMDPPPKKILPIEKLMFVMNDNDNSISVIDTEHLTKVKDIEVGKKPGSATLSVDGKYLFVMNADSKSVSVIDTEHLTKVKDIEVGQWPAFATPSLDGKHLFVVNMNSNSISVIDTEHLTKVKDIEVGNRPAFATLSLDGKHLFVMNVFSGSVSVIDTEHLTKVKDIEVGQRTASATLSLDGKYLCVVNYGSNSISIINTEHLTKVQDIEVGIWPLSGVVYKSSYIEPTCITMIKDVAEGITQGALEEKDISHLFPLLQEVRNVFQAIPLQKVEGVLKDCMTVLSVLQSHPDATGDLIMLQNFFHGAQERLTYPLTESTFNNDAFQKAYDELVFLHSHQQGLNKADQVMLTLIQSQQKIQKIIKGHPTLIPIERDVLTFMGLQILWDFMDEGEKAASKNLRLEFLHFIDGYNIGERFVIPLPGMEEDQRTQKDFIRLIEMGKF